MDKQEFALWCEQKAAEWLRIQYAWQLKESRASFRGGELDLIFEHDSALKFVEVKGIRNQAFGHVVERLTREKIRRLRVAIAAWRQKTQDFRFGELWFVGVEIDNVAHTPTFEIFRIE